MPWHVTAGYSSVALRRADLDNGIWGLTDFADASITVRPGLNENEQRCTLTHELLHLERGPVKAGHDPSGLPYEALEEFVIELLVAARLVASFELPGLAHRVAVEGGEAVADALEIDDTTLDYALHLADLVCTALSNRPHAA